MLWTFNFPGCKQRPHLYLPIPAENGLNERLSLYLERSDWNWNSDLFESAITYWELEGASYLRIWGGDSTAGRLLHPTRV